MTSCSSCSSCSSSSLSSSYHIYVVFFSYMKACSKALIKFVCVKYLFISQPTFQLAHGNRPPKMNNPSRGPVVAPKKEAEIFRNNTSIQLNVIIQLHISIHYFHGIIGNKPIIIKPCILDLFC